MSRGKNLYILVHVHTDLRVWVGKGNIHIDTDLAGFQLALEFGGGGTRSGEDRSTITIFVRVDEGDGVVDGFHFETDEDGAEDLFPVAAHVWLYVGDDGGANLFANHVSDESKQSKDI